MALPLLEQIAAGDSRYGLAPGPSALVRIGDPPDVRIPARKPGPGEQYRFHFDMTKCIGCRCCEVACNEQNNNPADILWRRVGEIEAGQYPFTQRFHLSMGCNHCLEAACLIGCPVDAYRKDAFTGVVLHDPEICIGCQYCTWNCPYGVPQFNEERGVVGKCDMCHHRLAEGREPACVNACPEGAIRIEIVNIGEWRKNFHREANAPGMPPAETTISTTRITAPAGAEAGFQKADYARVRPEHPHWPLVVMLVLTQLSVGALWSVLAGSLSGWIPGAKLAAVAALVVGHLALAASTLHLGRPIHAYRALRMWKRSWLSREVLSFGLFAAAATAYAALVWTDAALAAPAGLAASAIGLVGVVCSAFIYMVPARPAWNSWRTVLEFLLTALLLGPVFAACFGSGHALDWLRAWTPPVAALVLAAGASRLAWLNRSGEFELRQSARLLLNDLCPVVKLRVALLAAGAALIVFFPVRTAAAAALPLLAASEIAGRYLFFVSVVPRNIAATFFSRGREAA
jgi:formate dehydrogenase iron-sulfur subunit